MTRKATLAENVILPKNIIGHFMFR